MQKSNEGIFDRLLGRISSEIKQLFSTDFLVQDFKTFDEKSSEIARNLLQGRDAAYGIRQGFAEAAENISKLGGDIEHVYEIQKGVLQATQRNVQLLDKDVYEKLFAAQKITGENAGLLLRTYKDIGVSSYETAQNVQIGVNKAREMGVSVNSVFDKITGNLSKINEFNFQNGVEGFSKMAAKATALRTDMKFTFDFAEKVMNPEGAIEMANAFQRLGVGTSQLLDPLRLMDLSMNDPEELQNQLSKMTEQFSKFNSETGRFEILPGAKRMLRELAKDTGKSYEELARMSLASAELSKKLSEIKFPEFANKDQQEMIANLAEMKGGQYVVQVQEKDKEGNIVNKEKAISELKPEDMQRLIDANKGEDMVELTRKSMSIQETMASYLRSIQISLSGGIASSATGEKVSRGAMSLARRTTESIQGNVTNVKSVSNNVDKFAGVVSDLIDGNKSIIDAFGNLETHIKDKTIPGFVNMFDDIKKKLSVDEDWKFSGGDKLAESIFKLFTTKLNEFKSLPTTNTENKKNAKDLIVTKEGAFEPSENDVITAFEQGGIISKTMKGLFQNMDKPEINLIPLTELMSKVVDNLKNNQQSNNIGGEMTVKFDTLKIDITGNNLGDLESELRKPNVRDQIVVAVTNAIENNLGKNIIVKGAPNSLRV